MKIREMVLLLIFIITLIILTFIFKEQGDYIRVNGSYIKVEIADSPEERAKGLAYRDSLAEQTGMLFVFENSGILRFWMKDTLISLDIIFIDENMGIVKIIRNAQPCLREPCEIYSSFSFAKYALEINGGEAERLGINEGEIVELRRQND